MANFRIGQRVRIIKPNIPNTGREGVIWQIAHGKLRALFDGSTDCPDTLYRVDVVGVGKYSRTHIGAHLAYAAGELAPLTDPAADAYDIDPIEADKAMREAGEDAAVKQYENSDWEEAKDMAEAVDAAPIWRAMLAAAPTPEGQ